MFAYRDVQRAVRGERWKLIRYPSVDKTQLFDLFNDPQETRNLAESLEHATKVAAMLAMLKREQEQFGDPSPLRVPNPQPAEWIPPKPGNISGEANRLEVSELTRMRRPGLTVKMTR